MESTRLDRRLVALLAFSCGATVANLYYAQPLLSTIARALDVSDGAAGLLVTASQVGYAIGLVLLVPLGDLKDRRTLTSRTLIVGAVALAAAAAAPTLGVLAAAIALVGVTSCVAQILVPFANLLAGDEERGRVVGLVMSGLITGILVARVVAGLLAEIGGWRVPFAFAAVLMLVLAFALRAALPAVEPATDLRYPQLLKSIFTLVREEPILRRRMIYGACGFSEFAVLWTAIAFLLAGEPFGYSEGAIGLISLSGVLGAVAAQRSGVLYDRGLTLQGTGAGLITILLGWVLLAAGKDSLVILLAGLVVIDLGIQMQHILSQNTIYAARPDARSRVTTAYMTFNFAMGALGSVAGTVAWSHGGWPAVCAVGGAIGTIALLTWIHELLTRSR